MSTDDRDPHQDPAVDPSSGPSAGPGGDLDEWREIWEEDRSLPIESHRRGIGWLVVGFKRLLRSFVKTPQNDLWERQRRYNMALRDHVVAGQAEQQRVREQGLPDRLDRLEGPVHQELADRADAVAGDLQKTQAELTRDLRQMLSDFRKFQEDVVQLRDQHLEYLESHADRLVVLEGFKDDGLEDINRHTDALFARLDQKMTRYRLQSRELWSRMEALLAVAEKGEAAPLQRASQEQGYVELERLFRGSQDEIRKRLRPYLGYLEGRSPVLDLGCGRGESLEVLRDHGVTGSGIDSSAEMVAQCREKGLEASVGDLFETLAETEAESLGAVVSFHVIEHLPAESLDRLVRLAWRALRPGGVLILETPNPLSVVVAARNFWLDPTHKRPVHPASLKLSYELAGFEPVVKLDLQPFSEKDRLPHVDLDEVGDSLKPVLDGINRLRDRLDEVLFGYQDFGMVGFKPEG